MAPLDACPANRRENAGGRKCRRPQSGPFPLGNETGMENSGHPAQGQNLPLPVGKAVEPIGRRPTAHLRHLSVGRADAGELPDCAAEAEKAIPATAQAPPGRQRLSGVYACPFPNQAHRGNRIQVHSPSATFTRRIHSDRCRTRPFRHAEGGGICLYCCKSANSIQRKVFSSSSWSS